jgi:Tol biopolymer transport system component
MHRRRAIAVSALIAAAIAIGLLVRGGSTPSRTALVYGEAAAFPGLNQTIWRANPTGGDHHKILEGEYPQLSPDGRLVAFTRSTSTPRTSDVLVVRTGGGNPTVLERLAGDHIWTDNVPTWAPDSRHLAVSNNVGLFIVDTKTGARKLLLRQRRNASIESVGFSPDSRSIVYGVVDRTGGDIFIEQSTGGRPRRITHDHQSFNPVWGLHGIAFNRGGFAHGDIWTIAANGSRIRRLTRTHAGIYPASFSADGSRLLAANPAMHNGRLWAIDLRTGRARDLTGWRGDLFPQGLSRDGSTILAAVGCGGTLSPYGYIETLPFGGGKPHVLVRGPCRASWSY